jgi:hypothetical protein
VIFEENDMTIDEKRTERCKQETCKQSLQVEEQQGPEHISSPDCWCEPELDYKDPDTGAEVWVHRGLQ